MNAGTKPQTHLLSLPNELLINIAKALVCGADAFALLLTCRRLSHAAASVLYAFAPASWGAQTTLQWACEQGYTSLVLALLQNCADPNECSYTSYEFGARPTALHLAVLRKNLPCATALVHYGADINATCRDDQTPLHIAVSLLEVDSDPDVLALIRMLLEHGADPNTSPPLGSPLHVVAGSSGDVKPAIYLLLEYGASIEARDYHGRTPLQVADSYGRATNAEALIDAGADLNAKSCKGDTELTAKARWRDTLQMLRRKEAEKFGEEVDFKGQASRTEG